MYYSGTVNFITTVCLVSGLYYNSCSYTYRWNSSFYIFLYNSLFGPEILTPGNEQVFLQNFMWPLLMCEMPKQSRAKMILYIYTKC